jgi:rhamnosyltransferase
MKRYSVCAGIVAHNPGPEGIGALVEELLSCAEWVVVIDNNSDDTDYLLQFEGRPGVDVVRNAENGGVSIGINQIIDYARKVRAKYVTAYDQDTQISKGLVSKLAQDLEELIESGKPAAAVGPLVIDDFTNHTLPFISFRLPLNARYRSGLNRADHLVECNFLISSGCLMSMAAIDEIGAMNEALFIDNVDLDWCFRATSKRYKIYGDFEGVIRQRIGDSCTQIPFTKSVVRYHNAKRNYYMTRNRFWLYRQAYVNSAWVIHDICRFSVKLLYLTIFHSDRVRFIKSSVRGIFDSFSIKPYEDSKA